MSTTPEMDGAIAEVTGERPAITFAGESFGLADKFGLMPLMRFAKAARAGADSSEMEGLAALYDLLADLIAPQDWDRFETAATRTRADGDALLAVVQDAIVAVASRPTARPSDSSDGPSSTSVTSRPDSSSPVSYRPVSHIREMSERHGWPRTG